MAKRAFDKIMAGLTEAVEIAEGRADPSTYRVHIPAEIDVKALRKSLGLTQEAFANQYGFSLGTVRDWEQGRTVPEPNSRAYLKAISKAPAVIARALEDA